MTNIHVRRPLQINLHALLLQQTPTIDLGVESYENSTRNFLEAVSKYKNRSMTAIAERRRHEAHEKKKIMDKIVAVESETGQCKMREIELVAQLEREKEERKDAELSVAAFKRQLASLKDKITSVESDIEQYRAVVQNLRREKNKDRAMLNSHAAHLSPELKSCENKLGCTIEGVQADRLLIRFFGLDPTDPERDASFVLDMSSRNYKVITASPHLPTMAMLVNALNETRDIFGFMRNVRTAYKPLFDARSR